MPKQPSWPATIAVAALSFSAVASLGHLFLWVVSR